DGIRDLYVTGVQTCALPISAAGYWLERRAGASGQRAWQTRLQAPWARPFLAFAALDVAVWQMVAAASPGTGLFVAVGNALLLGRSEERRVGKECRYRWWEVT